MRKCLAFPAGIIRRCIHIKRKRQRRECITIERAAQQLGYEVTWEEMKAQGPQELTDDELYAASGGFLVRGAVGDIGYPLYEEYGADEPALFGLRSIN